MFINPESHVGAGLLQVLADICSVEVPVTAMLALWSAVSLSLPLLIFSSSPVATLVYPASVPRFESSVLKTHSLAFNIPGIFPSYSELSSLSLLFTRILASLCFHISNCISFCHR